MSSSPRCAAAPTVSELYGDTDAATRQQRTAWLDAGDGGEEFTSDAEVQFAAATDAVDDLGEEFLGGYLDYEDRTYVYVTDPAADVDPDVIAERLSEATEQFRFRVEPGCHPRADLQQVHDEITSPDFLDDWEHNGLGVGIGPATGTVEVTIGGPAPDGLADDLEERYGPLVTVQVEDGAVAQTAGSRFNDRQPHYGGARISAVGSGNCTSGFAVDLPGGPRIVTTAAHCATANGVTVLNGQGSRYGQVRHRSYPAGDVASIHETLDGGRTYHRFVWTGHEINRIDPREPAPGPGRHPTGTRMVSAHAHSAGAHRGLIAALAMLGSACGPMDSVSVGSADDASPTPWSVESPPGEQTTDLDLEVVVGSSGCSELEDIEVEESDQQVTVQAYRSFIPAENCPADSNHEAVTVGLDEPLGNRELVGCDPFDFDDACRTVNRQRLDPINFGVDTTKFGEVDEMEVPADELVD